MRLKMRMRMKVRLEKGVVITRVYGKGWLDHSNLGVPIAWKRLRRGR